MKSTNRILALAASAMLVASANATWYTSEAAFLAATVGPNYTEDFNNFTSFGTPLNGTQTTWNAPGGNGFGFQAAAATGLWSNIGALSTDTSNDPITLTLTGNPTTAFGARVANTDIAGAFIPGQVTLNLSNGANTVVDVTGGEQFIGWADSNVTITTATFTASSAATNNWVQLDHIIQGTATPVPEPATLSVLALGALAAIRRRKAK